MILMSRYIISFGGFFKGSLWNKHLVTALLRILDVVAKRVILIIIIIKKLKLNQVFFSMIKKVRCYVDNDGQRLLAPVSELITCCQKKIVWYRTNDNAQMIPFFGCISFEIASPISCLFQVFFVNYCFPRTLAHPIFIHPNIQAQA